MQRSALLISLCLTLLVACKNNGSNSGSSTKTPKEAPSKLAAISVKADATTVDVKELDFQVQSWEALHDTLIVVVRYSGGCAEHKFNATFSGGWLKSMPPVALINLEHIRSKDDPCREMIKDTLLFDLTSVRYTASTEVNVKWASDPNKVAKYSYGN